MSSATGVEPSDRLSASIAGSDPAWPAVSVVVATHGRRDLLPRTVAAILGQDYAGAVECLIVFDGEEPSPVDTQRDERRSVRTLVNDRTRGPAGARNTGALAARGQLVAFCDDDDEWLPGKLRAQVTALRTNPDASVATCGIVLRSGRRRRVRIPPRDRLLAEDLERSRLAEVHTSTLVVRREALHEIGLLDEAIPGSYGEEYDWLHRAARTSPILVVGEPLVRVDWGRSYFAENWEAIVEGVTYRLARSPELARNRTNLARLRGRVAFAHAARGRRGEALRWAWWAFRARWKEPRSYMAALVACRLLPARAVVRVAHRFGRGV